MRVWWLVAMVGLGGCVAQSSPLGSAGLQQAARNFPPLIIGANTDATSGPVTPRSCPAPGSRVEQKGGPTMEYLGAVPGSPDLCRMRVGGENVQGWYGIWLTDWPGAAQAYPALTRAMRGGTGTVEGFDVDMAPGYAYHDLIRNEGVEHIKLLGKTYDAIKLAHYREGADGNTYRSVSTIWKDLPTGLLIYGTYQHISGTPVTDDPLIPTAIVPAR
ncbi:MAG: hypothetical protein RQ966_13700 [Acetobacteraceae bacterium]|nr:hypothetical protein [Acetobacteraceae bacterium]